MERVDDKNLSLVSERFIWVGVSFSRRTVRSQFLLTFSCGDKWLLASMWYELVLKKIKNSFAFIEVTTDVLRINKSLELFFFFW